MFSSRIRDLLLATPEMSVELICLVVAIFFDVIFPFSSHGALIYLLAFSLFPFRVSVKLYMKSFSLSLEAVMLSRDAISGEMRIHVVEALRPLLR